MNDKNTNGKVRTVVLNEMNMLRRAARILCFCLGLFALLISVKAPAGGMTVYAASTVSECPPVMIGTAGLPESERVFSAVLEAEDENNPMPEGSTGGIKKIRIKREGEAARGSFGYTEYTLPGRYFYRVRQLAGTRTGVTYDDREYRMMAEVTEGAGGLKAVYIISDPGEGGSKYECFLFVNSYDGADVEETSAADPGSGRHGGNGSGDNGTGTNAIENSRADGNRGPAGSGSEDTQPLSDIKVKGAKGIRDTFPGEGFFPKTGDDEVFREYLILGAGLSVFFAIALYMLIKGRRKENDEEKG